MSSSNAVFRLKPFVQHYDWGKLGNSSLVAQLCRESSVDDSEPYAELWMGSHVNGPCWVDGVAITDWLPKNESIDFLFKILSVGKALSIQSHPDADLAKRLHAEFPGIYKDANSKPELAIALTDFKAMFGFRHLKDIMNIVRQLEPLAALLGEMMVSEAAFACSNGSDDDQQFSLKKIFSLVMSASTSDVKRCVCSLLSITDDTAELKLMRELVTQFSVNDVGVLCVFFLNVVNLAPGEALFMGPNIPHAYISGDIVECMTCSDNVIRGGLTSKYRDVKIFVDSLIYTPKCASLFEPSPLATWSPPDVPFAVRKFSVDKSAVTEWESTSTGYSIAIVTAGEGTFAGILASKGDCFLVKKSTYVRIFSTTHIDVFVAYSPYQVLLR